MSAVDGLRRQLHRMFHAAWTVIIILSRCVALPTEEAATASFSTERKKFSPGVEREVLDLTAQLARHPGVLAALGFTSGSILIGSTAS